jgi:hypothetical protein
VRCCFRPLWSARHRSRRRLRHSRRRSRRGRITRASPWVFVRAAMARSPAPAQALEPADRFVLAPRGHEVDPRAAARERDRIVREIAHLGRDLGRLAERVAGLVVRRLTRYWSSNGSTFVSSWSSAPSPPSLECRAPRPASTASIFALSAASCFPGRQRAHSSPATGLPPAILLPSWSASRPMCASSHDLFRRPRAPC